MSSPLLALIIIIVFLAFIFAKSKGKAPRKKDQYNSEGRRKNFKDFQKEQLERDTYGNVGEAVMAQTVAKLCEEDGRKFVLMKNLYIPNRGGTTEIDSLLLHQTGIYVLESKNISGEITGGIEDERWNQRLNARTEHTFHNPIQQNAGHIRALQHFLKENYSRAQLNIDDLPIFSAIVFSDRCALKHIPVQGENWIILHMFQLQDRLANLIKKQRTIFSTNQLEDIYWKLEPCTKVSDKVKAEHRAYIKSAHKN